jgi:hypothetical protein
MMQTNFAERHCFPGGAPRECEKFQIAQVNKTGNVEVAGLK